MLQRFIDAMPDFVLLVEENHCIAACNTAVHQSPGRDKSELCGGYCPRGMHGMNGPFRGCPLEEALQRGAGWKIARIVLQHRERMDGSG